MVKSLLFSCTLLVKFRPGFPGRVHLRQAGAAAARRYAGGVEYVPGLFPGGACCWATPMPTLRRTGWGSRRHALIHLGLAAGGIPAAGGAARPCRGGKAAGRADLLAAAIAGGQHRLAVCPSIQLRSAGAALVCRSVGGGQVYPYFLYTASNLGSLLGLVVYPFVVEPRLSLAEQNQAWTWAFVSLAGLLAALRLLVDEPGSDRGERERESGGMGKTESGRKRSPSETAPSPPLPLSPLSLGRFVIRWMLLGSGSEQSDVERHQLFDDGHRADSAVVDVAAGLVSRFLRAGL